MLKKNKIIEVSRQYNEHNISNCQVPSDDQTYPDSVAHNRHKSIMWPAN
jgi:hypothetical protein